MLGIESNDCIDRVGLVDIVSLRAWDGAVDV